MLCKMTNVTKKIKKSTDEYVHTIQGLGILCIKISFLPSFLHT